MNASSEAELVARCQQGESGAWEMLFDQCYAPVARFLFQLSPDFSHEDVEELCQEVFVSVIKGIGSFHGRSQLQTWIFRIAVNKARDFRERTRAVKRGGGQVPLSLDEDLEHGGVREQANPGPAPDALLMAAEQGALVRSALERLGDPCREIIQLRYFGDLSYDEIGQALKLNPKTVSSRLSKCLDRLEMIARPIFGRKRANWERVAPFPV